MKRKGTVVIVSILLGTLLVVALAPAAPLPGEGRVDVFYGRGVHAFFGGDYVGAIDLLKQVVELDGVDPRPHYFIAIAQRRLKQNDQADASFKKAARLEYVGRSARDFDISGELRRIQGNERIHIENYRKQAKLDWEKEEARRREVRYQQKKVEDKGIVQNFSKLPVGTAPFGAQSVDPFRTKSDVSDAIVPKNRNFLRPSDGKEFVANRKMEDNVAEEDDPFAMDVESPFGMNNDSTEKSDEDIPAETVESTAGKKEAAPQSDDDDPFKEFE